jgi:O-methyltransferase
MGHMRGRQTLRTLARPIAGALESIAGLFGRRVVTVPAGSRFHFDILDRNELTAYQRHGRLVQLYEDSMRATGMEWSDNFYKRCRYFSMSQLVETAMLNSGEGDVAECGCWRGHSAHLIATILRERGFTGRFHIFDSFDGLSELAPEDRDERTPLTTDGVRELRQMFACSEAVVRGNLAAFPFIETHKGWIPNRFSDVADRTFRFVHVDVDLYQPIRDSIEFFYPRLTPAGLMVFDDYGLEQFPGAQKAVDEAVARLAPSFFYQVPTGGAFIVR